MSDPSVGSDAEKPLSLAEYEKQAEERMPPVAWDYYATGADDELLLRQIRPSFDAIKLWPRCLCDEAMAAPMDLSINLLGHRLQVPFVIAPTAKHGLAHQDGEVATAKAAAATGALMAVSCWSSKPVSDIVAAAPCSDAPKWYQLHMHKDRNLTLDMLRRLESMGFTSVVLPVDFRRPGRQLRNARNNFVLTPPQDYKVDLGSGSAASQLKQFKKGLKDGVSWQDVEWLIGNTKMAVVLKGVLRADEAREAVARGVSAIIVSNHGGRQLDAASPAIEALRGVADAVRGTGCAVILDTGVRRGTDVVRALALGAHAVMIGRPILWALAVDGQSGVEHMLKLLREETERALALCGCFKPQDCGAWLLQQDAKL